LRKNNVNILKFKIFFLKELIKIFISIIVIIVVSIGLQQDMYGQNCPPLEAKRILFESSSENIAITKYVRIFDTTLDGINKVRRNDTITTTIIKTQNGDSINTEIKSSFPCELGILVSLPTNIDTISSSPFTQSINRNRLFKSYNSLLETDTIDLSILHQSFGVIFNDESGIDLKSVSLTAVASSSTQNFVIDLEDKIWGYFECNGEWRKIKPKIKIDTTIRESKEIQSKINKSAYCFVLEVSSSVTRDTAKIMLQTIDTLSQTIKDNNYLSGRYNRANLYH
jgi:hypothetical protein